VHFVGFALVFGVVGYQALTQAPQRSERLTATGVVLLIAAEPIALLGQLASLSFDGDTALAVLDSNFGRLLGLRLGAALLVWTLMATRRYWVLLGLGAVVALLDGMSAHAIPGFAGVGQLQHRDGDDDDEEHDERRDRRWRGRQLHDVEAVTTPSVPTAAGLDRNRSLWGIAVPGRSGRFRRPACGRRAVGGWRSGRAGPTGRGRARERARWSTATGSC